MKAIVTGATGFIGYALCQELLKQGEEVVAIIRPSSAHAHRFTALLQENPDYRERFSIEEVPLDALRDYAEIVLRQQKKADVLYHLAWNGSSGADREDFDIQQSNIRYTADAIRLAKAYQCHRFIGAGSQAEYGVVHGIANEENTICKPFMMYGAAKLSCYHMGRLLAGQLGIRFVWSRIYSVYGAGENEGTLLSYLCNTLKEGSTPQLSACGNMWNFLEIGDCAKILVLLGTSYGTNGIYNVASPDTRILKEYIKQARDIISSGAGLGFGEKTSDPQKTYWLNPDITRLKMLLETAEPDFSFTSFEDGIRRKVGDGRLCDCV